MNNELKIFENAEFGSIRTVEIDSTPCSVIIEDGYVKDSSELPENNSEQAFQGWIPGKF